MSSSTRLSEFRFILLYVSYTHGTDACRGVQEVLEYNTYSKAADVYSLGAILWEILHSKPCYRRTVVGFPVRHPDFPKFSDSAPLPYAALTAACLHSNPSLRCGPPLLLLSCRAGARAWRMGSVVRGVCVCMYDHKGTFTGKLSPATCVILAGRRWTR